MIRQYIRDYPARWRALSDAKKAKWLGQLEDAGDVAHAIMMDPGGGAQTGEDGERIGPAENAVKLEAARVVVSVVRTGTMIERQNQIEQIKQAEWDRLDAGKVTARTEQVGSTERELALFIMQDPSLAPLVERLAALAPRPNELPPGDGAA